MLHYGHRFYVRIFFVCLRPCSLSWKKVVGVRRFAASYWGPIAGWTIVLIFSSIMVLALMMAVGGTYENEKKGKCETEYHSI